MNNNYIKKVFILSMVLLSFQAGLQVSAASSYIKFNLMPEIDTSRLKNLNNKSVDNKPKKEISYNNIKTLDVSKWNNLRATSIPGVYCQIVDDYGQYKHQKHYYFNTKIQKMIEVPGIYQAFSTEDLGDYESDYEKYGAKTNTFTYKNKKYTIKVFEGF